MNSSAAQPVLNLRHHLAIGLGVWGAAALEGLARGLGTASPELRSEVEVLSITGRQAAWLNWLPAWAIPVTAGGADQVQDWLPRQELQVEDVRPLVWEALHFTSSQEKAERLFRLGLAALSGEQANVDVHLFASPEEAPVRRLLLPLAGLLEQVAPSAVRFRLFLYLGLDSSGWSGLPVEQAEQISRWSAALERWLGQHGSAGQNGLQLCFVLDSVDEEARRWPASAAAELAGGLAALLVGSELGQLPAFEALQAYPSQAGLRARRGYVAAAGLACVTGASGSGLTFVELQQRRALQAAAALLESLAVGAEPDRESLLAAAAGCRLGRAGLEQALLGDELTGLPPRFEPGAALEGDLTPLELVKALRSWELGPARQRLEQAVEFVQQRAGLLAGEHIRQAQFQVDQLMCAPSGGPGSARLFCLLLVEQVRKSRQAPALPSKRRHWLGEFFRRLFPPLSERELDAQAAQRRLERALNSRVSRRAAWLQSALKAALGYTMLAAAWPFLPAGLLAGAPAYLLLGGVVFLILSWQVLSASWLILSTELEIYKARQDWIEVVRGVYRRRLQETASAGAYQVLDSLEAALEAELSALQARSQAVLDLHAWLLERLQPPPALAPTLALAPAHEQRIECASPQTGKRALDKKELEVLRQQVLQDRQPGYWRTERAGSLLCDLLRRTALAAPGLGERLPRLAEGDLPGGRLSDLEAELASRLRLRLGLEGFPEVHRQEFWVQPAQVEQLPANRALAVGTGQLSLLRLACGLPLARLALWKRLERLPAAGAKAPRRKQAAQPAAAHSPKV